MSSIYSSQIKKFKKGKSITVDVPSFTRAYRAEGQRTREHSLEAYRKRMAMAVKMAGKKGKPSLNPAKSKTGKNEGNTMMEGKNEQQRD